jgi:predicted DNA-binding protein with PD1-like motif
MITHEIQIDRMQGPRTYIAILETGDEVATSLNRLAEENKLAGSSFKAIGALSGAKVGWFNWQTKKYETVAEFKEQLEGSIAHRRHRAQGRPAGRPCASDPEH